VKFREISWRFMRLVTAKIGVEGVEGQDCREGGVVRLIYVIALPWGDCAHDDFVSRYEEGEILEWYDGFMQDCPSGKLTQGIFIAMFKEFFPASNPVEFAKSIFRTFDKDHNGYIDFTEFLLAIDVTSAGSATDRLKWAFRCRFTKLFERRCCRAQVTP